MGNGQTKYYHPQILSPFASNPKKTQNNSIQSSIGSKPTLVDTSNITDDYSMIQELIKEAKQQLLRRTSSSYPLLDRHPISDKSYNDIFGTPTKEIEFDFGYEELNEYFPELFAISQQRFCLKPYQKDKAVHGSHNEISVKFNGRQILHQIPRGYGKLELALKSKKLKKDIFNVLFEGQFSQTGILNGEAKFKNILNGDAYQGQMQNYMASGKGSFVKSDRSYTYTGQWQKNMPLGFGQIKWLAPQPASHSFNKQSNYVRYTGEIVNNKRHGRGILFIDDYVFDGQFQNDQLEGYCQMYSSNGEKYEGDWHENQKDGHGLYRWSNGDLYDGAYWKDKRHGYGIMYEGLIDKENSIQQNKQIQSKSTKKASYKIVYQGMWKKGLKEGQGTLTQNNRTIRGIWAEGKLFKIIQQSN